MKNNTYRLYQMKDMPEMKPYIHQSFGTLIALGYHPSLKDYNLAVSGLLTIEDNMRTVCEKIRAKQVQMHRCMGTGDILVVKNDVVICYFYDTMGFALLDNFYVVDGESTALRLSIDSKNISLPGCTGHWNVINLIAVEMTRFFLLQSVEHGSSAAWIIADEAGNVIIDDNRTDFDGETVQKLRQYLRPELSDSPPKRHHAPENPNKACKTAGSEHPGFQKRMSLRLRLQEKQRELHQLRK